MVVHFELYRDDDGEVRRADNDELWLVPDLMPPGKSWCLLLVDVEIVPDSPAPIAYRRQTPEYGPPEIEITGMRLQYEHNVNGMDAEVEYPVPEIESSWVLGAYQDEIEEMAMEEA